MKEIKSDTYKWSPEFELQKSVWKTWAYTIEYKACFYRHFKEIHQTAIDKIVHAISKNKVVKWHKLTYWKWVLSF